MNLLEATKRLQENRDDKTALQEFYNRFDPFIIHIVTSDTRHIRGFDFSDAEQELRQTLLEVIDRYQPGYTEEQWSNYIAQALRNRLHDMVRSYRVETKRVPRHLEDPTTSEEGNEAMLLDELAAVEKSVYEILEYQEADKFINDFQEELRSSPGEKSQLAWKLLMLILEAEPESLSLRALWEQLKEMYPEDRWYWDKLSEVLKFLRVKLEATGFSDEFAFA